MDARRLAEAIRQHGGRVWRVRVVRSVLVVQHVRVGLHDLVPAVPHVRVIAAPAVQAQVNVRNRVGVVNLSRPVQSAVFYAAALAVPI